MGLDMYLHKRTYVQNWDHMEDSEKHQISITKGGCSTAIELKRISHITEQVAYWRKSNQIHKWFVENVQNGVDDCGDYHVSEDDLKELLNQCEQIFKDPDKGKELLPTQSGFFFGGTEYDEYYHGDIHDTIKVLKKLLKETSGNFYYSSSW